MELRFLITVNIILICFLGESQYNEEISRSNGTFRNCSNRTDEDVILLAFYMGEKGSVLSVYK